MAKMTTEEAFVKVLQKHGIQHAFGIIGSAFMPISDLFPKANNLTLTFDQTNCYRNLKKNTTCL